MIVSYHTIPQQVYYLHIRKRIRVSFGKIASTNKKLDTVILPIVKVKPNTLFCTEYSKNISFETL